MAIHTNRNIIRAHVGMFVRALIIGYSFNVVGSMGTALPPLLLTAFRFVIAAIAMTPFLWRARDRRPGRVGFAIYCALGLCQALFFGSMFLVAHQVSALFMTALYVTVPFMAYSFGLLFRVEQPSVPLLGILALGAAGAIGLTWAGSGATTAGFHVGTAGWIFFAGCFGIAIYSVLSRWGLLRRYISQNAGVRTFWSLAIGAALVGALGLAEEQPRALAGLTARDILLLAYLGLLSTGATFWLMQRAAAVLTPAEVSAYSYAPPFVSMLVLFAGDPHSISWRWLPGAALVAAAMALLLVRDVARKANTTPPQPIANQTERTSTLCE